MTIVWQCDYIYHKHIIIYYVMFQRNIGSEFFLTHFLGPILRDQWISDTYYWNIKNLYMVIPITQTFSYKLAAVPKPAAQTICTMICLHNSCISKYSSSSSALQHFVSFGLLNYFSPWFPFLCLLFPVIYSPSSSNRLSRHHPILILAYLSVLLRVVSIYKCF